MENSDFTATSLSNWVQQKLAVLYQPEECSALCRLLIEHYAGIDRANMILTPEQNIDKQASEHIVEATRRLLLEEPIQHIIGHTEFYGLPINVNSNVLIPRQETEELVDWILSKNRHKQDINILDIGTGSGCIAISLAHHLPQAQVAAWDISPLALEVALHNAMANTVKIAFALHDILASPQWQGAPLDIIVSNPPYVLEEEKAGIHHNVLLHDPHLALFVPNEQPLLFYEAIARFAQHHLKPSGWLYFEINQALGPQTLAVLAHHGFVHGQLRKDLNGRDRMVRAQKQP